MNYKLTFAICNYVVATGWAFSIPSFYPIRNDQRFNSMLQMNFLKDIFRDAFENDKNLSPDRSKQQLESPNDIELDNIVLNNEKTDVQKRFLSSLQNNTSNPSSPEKKKKFIGAPMNVNLLFNTTWKISLYLTGIPNFDPTNSLYGSRVNISQRKDSTLAQAGLAIGADSLPENPSVELKVTLLPDGIVDVEESSFTIPTTGQWILSDDGRNVRFSFQVTGFQRTVTTKGTIQNVYWTDRENAERKSSAIYSIPAGTVYAETTIDYGSQPGMYVMGNNDIQGVLKVEKSTGMFGVTSKLLACGMFSALMIKEDSENRNL